MTFASKPSVQKLKDRYGIPQSKEGYKYVQENPNLVRGHESQSNFIQVKTAS